MVKVGDVLFGLVPEGRELFRSSPKSIPARVIYVHPEYRYFTVEFDCEYGKYREAFYTFPRSAATHREWHKGRSVKSEDCDRNQSQGRRR